MNFVVSSTISNSLARIIQDFYISQKEGSTNISLPKIVIRLTNCDRAVFQETINSELLYFTDDLKHAIDKTIILSKSK